MRMESGSSCTRSATSAVVPLRFVDFVHPPDEITELMGHVARIIGRPIDVVPVEMDVSAPTEEQAVALFKEGGADFGCL